MCACKEHAKNIEDLCETCLDEYLEYLEYQAMVSAYEEQQDEERKIA
jgi:hypothetical protein